uniref:Craniofacial development protein 2-like n=1 Tax=Nicotiana tabacum TaxID=4097 RepID=A0A1S4CW53_TOBAC|nr:PREDICTED: craniofacial development protein 2-like [Nicotiana tabacum]
MGNSIELAKILWRVIGNNGVGILVDRVIRELVVEVGLDEEVKRRFWEDLDGLLRGIPSTKNFIIGGDFNGHIGRFPGRYDGVHGGFGFGDGNGGGTSLLEYAKDFDLVIANSYYPKKADHLITFWSIVSKTQIDYLLLRKCDKGLCMDCKIIPSENLTTQHMFWLWT